MSVKDISDNLPFYTVGEEVANSVTHGIGTVLSVAGLTLLVTLAAIYGDVWRVVSFSIYGSCLVLLYLASTLYHSIQKPKAKRVFRILDHAAIYLLIAGTYTPFMLVTMRDSWGWPLFAVVWGIAITGIVFKTFFIGRYETAATVMYVLMGWLCIIAFKEMMNTIPPAGLVWLVTGGITYTVGVLFYVWEKLPYNHAIWHLFVLGGSICHFFGVLFHVLPKG